MCWNYRGAHKKSANNNLRHLIGEYNINFIGLLKTKVEDFSRKEIDKLVGQNWDYVFS